MSLGASCLAGLSLPAFLPSNLPASADMQLPPYFWGDHRVKEGSSQSPRPAKDGGGPTPSRRTPPSPHLSVDGPDDGRLEPHPRHKADVEVLVQDQRLQAGREEEEAGVEEALPAGGALVVDKVNEQPRKEKVEMLQEGTTGRALGPASPNILPHLPRGRENTGCWDALRTKTNTPGRFKAAKEAREKTACNS